MSRSGGTDKAQDALDRMSKLPPGQLEELLFRAKVAPQYLPGHTAPPMERIVAAIRYIERNGQLDQLARLLDTVSGEREFLPPAAIRRVPAVRYALATIAVASAAVVLHYRCTPQPEVSLLIMPDAEATAMIPLQSSPFKVSVVGRVLELPPEGVLIGTAHGVPASLRDAYRARVGNGEPVEFRIEYNADVEASVVVRYKGRPCKVDRSVVAEDTLWLVRLQECN